MTATSCTVDWVPTRLVFFECDMYRHRELCLWQLRAHGLLGCTVLPVVSGTAHSMQLNLGV